MYLISIVLTLFLTGCAIGPCAPNTPDTLVAGGDTVLCRWEHDLVARHGFDWPLSAVAPILRSANAALCNLECCVSQVGRPVDKGERCSFYYRARPEMLNCLTGAGIDIVCGANNHSADYGPASMAETCKWTKAAGLIAVGCGLDRAEAERPRLVAVGRTLVAFAGMHTSPACFRAKANTPGTAWVDEQEKSLASFTAKVKKLGEWARGRCHLLVLTIHWGKNWVRQTQPVHRRMARIAFANGVDVILGHSAHRLQGIEVIDGKVAIYDMGNLFFDCRLKEEGRNSCLFRLHFTPGGVERIELLPTLAVTGRAVPAGDKAGVAILAELAELSAAMGTRLSRSIDEWGRVMGVITVARPMAVTRPEPGQGPSFFPLPVKKKLTPPRAGQLIQRAGPGGGTPRTLISGIEVVGFKLPQKARAGRILPITCWLRKTGKTADRLLLAYRLVVDGKTTRRGTPWYTRHDPADWAVPFSCLHPGEVVVDRYPARLSGIPAGTCRVHVQIIDPARSAGDRKLSELFLGKVILK